MSATIDQKVVEMRFDNGQFEKNVSNTMSTLAKLKQSLNLTGASKGLENVSNAAKNVNMTGLSSAVETVHAKFSALEVMGVTALANITNQAVNAGKRIASALTIDPIKTGFQEYETQINAVQTILANTQSKGTTLNDVNNALDQLNKYADMTIYNFTEMTRNIGTFTAAGVDLDTSVSAIQGIANLAAVSGSTSQQASTAMYQLSQALASGTVKLQDWNSVVNAGMGGQVFQDALKRTAKVMGTDVDALIEKYGSFRESLTQGEWLTTDVLTETLNQFTMSAKEGTKEWEEYKKSLKEKGYTEEQANEILKMANTATDAATKVKTFTQLWDVLKEAAQSGWTQTWELIFGDFEEAKNLFTPLSDFLTGVINGMSEARNTLLQGALDSPFGKLAEKIEKVTGVTEKMNEVTKDYAGIVDKVIGGEYGNGQARWDKLAEEGYDWAKVQNLVNEKLGDSTRHTEQLTEAQKKQSKSQKTTIEDLVKMSDAQLKKLGFDEKEISGLRELEKQSKLTGIPIKDLVKDLDQLSGRTLLINSFKNVGQGLVAIFKAIGQAWREVFPPMKSDQLYNIIAGIHKFSTYLTVSDETADNLKRTLAGLFSVLGIISDITGGALKIAFKLVSSILKYFDTDILSVTASMGDALVAFRKVVNISNIFDKAVGLIIPVVVKAAEGIRGLASAFMELPIVKTIIKNVKDSIADFKNIDLREIGKNIIDGLKNGLGDGAGKVIDSIIEIGKSILTKIKEVLGIHSPSTEFFEIGQNIIQGLINGIQNGTSAIWDLIKGIGTKCADLLNNIDWSKIFAGGISVGMFIILKKFVDAIASFAAPFEGLGSVFDGAGEVMEKSAKGIGKILINTAKVVKSFAKVMSSFAFSIKAKALKDIAISLALLVGAVVVLSLIEDTDKLWNAVGIVTALAGVLIALSVATNLMSKASVTIGRNGVGISNLSSGLLSIGVSLLLLAATVKIIGSMKPEQAKQGFIGLAGALVAMLVVMGLYALMAKNDAAKDIDKLGVMLVKMSIAMLLMVGVIKLVSKLKPEEMKKGAVFAAGFLAFILGLQLIVTKVGNDSVDNLGGMLIKISLAMLLMIGVVKLASKLEWKEMGKGAAFVAGFLVFILGLQLIVTKVGNKSIHKLGTTMLALTTSLLLMILVVKLVGLLSVTELLKGGAFVAAFLGFVLGLQLIAKKISNRTIYKLGGTMIALSVAIGILAGICILLSLLDVNALGKGIAVVGALSIMMSVMIMATRGAADVKGTMIGIAIAIGVMAGAIALLSFIDPKKLIAPTIAMGALMAIFALIAKSASVMTGAMGPLIVMTVAVALIGGLIIGLSQLDVVSVLGSAAALSMVLLSLSASLLILGMAGPMAGMAIAGAVGLAGVIAILTTVLVALGALTKIDGFTQLIKDGGATLGLIGYALGNFVGSIVGGLAAGVMSGLPAIGASLSQFMVNVTPFIVGIKMVDMSVLTNTGILAGAILALTAADLINGIASFISGGFAELGTELSQFMINAMPFIMGASMINAEMMSGVKALAETILILTAADVVNGLTSWFTGGSSLEDFGAQLGGLATNISQFAANLGTFSEDQVKTVTCAANAIKAIAQAAEGIPNEGGWLAKIVGDNSVSTFGSYLPGLGTNISQFAANLGTFTEAQVQTVKCAANAIKAIAAAAEGIPNEGGWLAKIVGDNSIEQFGSYLPGLGTNISQFAVNLGTFTEAQVETVKCAASAIKEMALVAKDLPNEGGWLSKIVGDNSIAEFGSYLPGLGSNISGFATNLGTFSEDQVATVTCASNAIKAMAEAANGIPNEGGWLAKIVGDNSIETFGGYLPGLGKNLSAFAKNLGTFTDDKVNTVSSAVKTITAFSELASMDLKSVNKNLSNFGDKLGDFAKKLASFYSKLSEVDTSTVSTAASNISKIKSISKDIEAINAEAVSNFGKSLKKVGDGGLKSFIKSFSGSSAISDVKKAATTMVDSFIKGVESKDSKIKSAFTDSISEAIKGIKNTSNYSKFKDAGSYLVDGFAAGISSNTFKAEAKAKAMANAAEKAAKEALDINSPSKVFMGIGGSIPEGFAMGIEKFGSYVIGATDSMSDNALKSVSGAIARLAGMVDDDIDAQPTIRPVLDLSGVESGIGVLNGMFGMTPSVGVLSNVRAISSMMGGNQNGGNADILSALNDLKNTLSNNPTGDTYNINGITYDDGSNVKDAIETIVRAAKVERRK